MTTEYRVTFAWADDPATVEDHAERVADAFAAAVPEHGPAVGANLRTGNLEVTFTIDAESGPIDDLTARASRVFASGTAASGLYPQADEVRIVRVEVVAVEAEKRERALQPA